MFDVESTVHLHLILPFIRMMFTNYFKVKSLNSTRKSSTFCVKRGMLFLKIIISNKFMVILQVDWKMDT